MLIFYISFEVWISCSDKSDIKQKTFNILWVETTHVAGFLGTHSDHQRRSTSLQDPDTITELPETASQWLEEFNSPHKATNI
jgi:hypothetical protein